MYFCDPWSDQANVIGERHILRQAQDRRHRVQDNLGHSASPSLGHYATLSFVVVGASIKDGAR